MTEHRPNPEELLKRVQQEEQQKNRGKLKIYLGAAPGVGKTYTMLQDAIEKRGEGLDVVVGIVETHKRQEITEMVKELEILPLQTVDYRGKSLSEFDLDGALRRNPAVILMDEMAHTNAPGLRHLKRWQDIKELLDRGIDVYTTLNVQHIESLNDKVSQIIQTHIQETVPDSMIELADTVELVDLPPEDLLKRLQEGKVYFPAQAEIAKERFFREGNLIALRELALRVTAERVGEQVLMYRQGQGIQKIWPTRDKLLVCVGSRSGSVKLIRTACRMAAALQSEWVAVHVDAPRLGLSESQRNRAIHTLRLAEQLGAQTRIITGLDVVKEIMAFAREQNITQIMICKQIRPRWKSLFYRSLVDEVVRYSNEIDVYVVTNEEEDAIKLEKRVETPTSPWKAYLASCGIISLATIINFFAYYVLRDSNLILIYLLSILLVSLLGEMGPAILASCLAVFTYDFFFIPPYFAFSIPDISYFFSLFVMLILSLTISSLTILTRRQAQAAKIAEYHTATLHSLSRQLASSRGINKILDIACAYIQEVFDCDLIALLPENGQLAIHARGNEQQTLIAKEQGVAQWVYDLGQLAGLGTDTLPFSDALYVPLLGSQGTIGVLRVHPKKPNLVYTPEQMHLLEACANQIALAIEVDSLQDRRRKSELKKAADRAHNALLQSVSHDLHTPLTAAMGSASTLMEMGGELNTKSIKKLAIQINFELDQLNRLINNLLQMTYLEAESVKLQKELHKLSDAIHQALKSLESKLHKKPIQLQLPSDLPNIPFDITLIQEVFINLIDNAIKFTPPGSVIEIFAFAEKDRVIISVADHGPGILPDEVHHLFEKFYRGRLLTTERGMGLGLAICHSIIKAHGGDIWATNRKEGGAAFYFTLPLKNI